MDEIRSKFHYELAILQQNRLLDKNNKTYSTEEVENDASARPPNLTSTSCDVDL